MLSIVLLLSRGRAVSYEWYIGSDRARYFLRARGPALLTPEEAER